MTVLVHFQTPGSTVDGTVSIVGDWGATTSRDVSLPSGESTVSLQITAEDVSLWWPAGLYFSLYHRTY